MHRNLAEELVKEGLATVMNNPRDDQMSQCFDDLKKAEEIAKQSHKGLYSKSSPPKQRITDCSSAAVSKFLLGIKTNILKLFLYLGICSCQGSFA